MALPPPPPPPPPQAAPASQTPKAAAPQLAMAEPVKLAPKIVLLGVEGWGKTSCAAHMPKPAILMAREETGYLTLLGAGSVPRCLAATIESWPQLLQMLEEMLQQDQLPMESLVLDAIGGFERMMHEHVCARDFNGDWGEKGFANFQKGFDVSIGEWLKLIALLERFHKRNVTVMLLGHCQVRPLRNPLGEDYDRIVADVHHKTWAPTHRFADAVFFGTYISVIKEKKSGRAKGIGGHDRILYTTRRDAFDAKNRYGMPEAIEIADDPAHIWHTIQHYINGGE